MKVCKADVLSLQPLNFLIEVLFQVILLFREAEVSNFEEVPIVINEYVCRFDISMDKAFFMDVLETTNQLLEVVVDHLAVY
jgi:hypothetical protein